MQVNFVKLKSVSSSTKITMQQHFPILKYQVKKTERYESLLVINKCITVKEEILKLNIKLSIGAEHSIDFQTQFQHVCCVVFPLLHSPQNYYGNFVKKREAKNVWTYGSLDINQLVIEYWN